MVKTQNGILRENETLYASKSKQNGRAERKFRHILDTI